MSTTEHTGRPGKYQRSAFGLVVAMVTTVAAIVAAIWVMGLFRSSTEYKPPKVDYLEAVAAAQEGRLAVVYPATLPDGYIATQARVPADSDGFEIDLLKGDSDFIGIRTARTANVAALVHQDIDGNAISTASYDVPATVASPVAPTWSGWQGGGNSGYAAQVGKLTVLVYGAAPAADLQQVVDLLSTAPRKLK